MKPYDATPKICGREFSGNAAEVAAELVARPGKALVLVPVVDEFHARGDDQKRLQAFRPASANQLRDEACRLRKTGAKVGVPLLAGQVAGKARETYRMSVRKRPGEWIRFLFQFRQLLTDILLVATGITVALGEWGDAAVILGVVILNAIVGYLREAKAERALDQGRPRPGEGIVFATGTSACKL